MQLTWGEKNCIKGLRKDTQKMPLKLHGVLQTVRNAWYYFQGEMIIIPTSLRAEILSCIHTGYWTTEKTPNKTTTYQKLAITLRKALLIG